LKNTGSAHLLLGMSYYEINDLEKANKSLLKATKYNKSKKVARQWAEYIKESS
jgi:Tfp pilus assembly protein PilF